VDGQTFVPLGDIFLDVKPRGEVPSLRLYILPILRSLDKGKCVNFSISKSVAVLLADRSRLPVASEEFDGNGTLDSKILYVSPCQVGAEVQG
jgi:hypothetical protein